METPFNVFDLFRVDGDVALITGAGAGIGKMAATTLASAGARIAVTDVDGEAARAVAAEINDAGGDAVGYALDVADESAIVDTVASAYSEFGQLNILVNNAGITRRIPTEEFSSEDWHAILDVNLTAAFVACR
ncbi:MAG: SDR family NAD(P)-dependent oxidoreductase, partial [Bauldia sp.]|nr:SDR family NAD(P)-dependent oxidoreductase [Bauldia sp.]